MKTLRRLFRTLRAKVSHVIEQKVDAKDRALYRTFIDTFDGQLLIKAVEEMVENTIFTNPYGWNYPTTVDEWQGSIIAKRNRKKLYNFLQEFQKRDSSLMLGQELIICYAIMVDAGLFAGNRSKLMLNITVPDPENIASNKMVIQHFTDTEKFAGCCDGDCEVN